MVGQNFDFLKWIEFECTLFMGFNPSPLINGPNGRSTSPHPASPFLQGTVPWEVPLDTRLLS